MLLSNLFIQTCSRINNKQQRNGEDYENQYQD